MYFSVGGCEGEGVVVTLPLAENHDSAINCRIRSLMKPRRSRKGFVSKEPTRTKKEKGLSVYYLDPLGQDLLAIIRRRISEQVRIDAKLYEESLWTDRDMSGNAVFNNE
jgi:hypothetical protein